MKVRIARPPKAASLRALHLRTWQATFQGMLPMALFTQRLQEHGRVDWGVRVRLQEASGGHVLALIEREVLVGLCQYGPTEDSDLDPEQVGEVHRLYVDPDYQGRGGGRLLLDAAGEAFRQAGRRLATLWVFEADRRARGFYEHLGWRPDGGRQREAFPDVRYQLLLSPANE